MHDLTSLFAVGAAFFAVAVSPGPANIANSTLAMSRGRRPSLIFGAGLSTGLCFWGLVAATGMGAVLQASVYLLMTLKLFGGAYLLWLAWQSARSATRPGPAAAAQSSDGRWFLRGLVLNLSNPKSVIAWMAALAVGIGPDDGVGKIVAATLLCIALGFLSNFAYSMVFSLGGARAVYARIRRWVETAVAGLFALAGLGLIRSALGR